MSVEEIYVNCGHENCSKAFVDKLINIIKYTFKLYTITHFGPTLVFRFRELERNPMQTISKTFIKIIRSMAFLGGWMAVMRAYYCLVSYFKKKVDNVFFLVLTLLATAPSYAETTQRLNDYIVFIAPRATEGFWNLFERLNYVKSINHSEKILFIISMTIALYIRKYHKDSLPKNYEKAFTLVFGKN